MARPAIIKLHVLRAAILGRGFSQIELEDRTHHSKPDICNALNELITEDLIERSVKGPPRGQPRRKGRPSLEYDITRKGFQFLISSIDKPNDFWDYLIAYLFYRRRNICTDEIQNLCDYFHREFVEYDSIGNYLSLSVPFSLVCKRWLQDIIFKKVDSTVQKVLGTLAVNRGITLKELAEKVGKSKRGVRRALAMLEHTTDNKRSNYSLLDGLHDVSISEAIDIIDSNLIATKISNNTKTYELSLFGIILVFCYLAHDDSTSFLNSNLSSKDYQNKIIMTYSSDKLPLIFGKWNTISRASEGTSVYNLAVVYDEHSRSIVTREKNMRFLYDSIQMMSRSNIDQIVSILKSASDSYNKFLKKIITNEGNAFTESTKSRVVEEEMKSKLLPAGKLIQKLYSKWKQVIPGISYEMIWSKTHVGLHSDKNVGLVQFLEKAFNDEITTLFYVSLFLNQNIVTLLLTTNLKLVLYLSKAVMQGQVLVPSSNEILSQICSEDKQIKDFVTALLGDIRKFSENTIEGLKTLETGLRL